MSLNKTPEQLARDRIDNQLKAAGWLVQPQKNESQCWQRGCRYGSPNL